MIKPIQRQMANIQAAMGMGKFEAMEPFEPPGPRQHMQMLGINALALPGAMRRRVGITESHPNAAIKKEEKPKVPHHFGPGGGQSFRYKARVLPLNFWPFTMLFRLGQKREKMLHFTMQGGAPERAAHEGGKNAARGLGKLSS